MKDSMQLYGDCDKEDFQEDYNDYLDQVRKQISLITPNYMLQLTKTILNMFLLYCLSI